MKIAIIGGGIFGLYSSVELLKSGYTVELFEQGPNLGLGATKVNQARLHLGYHYPRSKKTALQCIKGFQKFTSRFPSAVNKDFIQYYAISKENSKTSAEEYIEFCRELNLPHEIEVLPSNILNKDKVQLNIRALEYSFDWKVIVNILSQEIKQLGGVINTSYKLISADFSNKKLNFQTPNFIHTDNFDIIINATYSNLNGINELLGAPIIDMEYELCEMAIVKVPKEYSNIGITIMDGDFTSIMPFGLSGYHSISNVRRTPHEKSKSALPEFSCNSDNEICSKNNLNICLNCPFKPKSWFDYMVEFAQLYIPWASRVEFVESLIAVKAIPSKVDETDERPSSIIQFEKFKGYYCIFSGKVDTVIDIAEELVLKIKSIS